MKTIFASLVLTNIAWTTCAFPGPKHAIPSLAVAYSKPPPPSKDPFYTAPLNYEVAAPGEVLKIRSAPGLAKNIEANCTAAYNILYRTTDSSYKPSWAVTTLYVPRRTSPISINNNTARASGSALLSYQVAYDSANIDGSPSYTFYDGTIIDPGIRTGLGLGWYVNVPDYEGPLAAFTAGVQSGHATIDSIRAVLNAGFGLAADANCALWGYSGGAAASEWAAELQVQYAPELRLAGIAMGGLTPNITSVAETLNGGPFAASIPEGMLGIVTQDPVAERYLLSQLKPTGPRNATAFLAARRVNTTVNAIVYANQDIFDYFVSGASVLRNYSPLRALADRDGVMGYHGIPAMPMFIYKAIGDEFSPVVDTDGLVERYCAVGANIHYTRNTVGGHLAEFFNGWDNAEAFLNAVLDGSYPAKYQSVGCTVRNVTIAVDSSPE